MGERQRANNGNEIAEEVLRLVVDRLPDCAFFTLDAQGAITSWNVGAEQLLGWRREQALRVHVSSVVGPGGRNSGIGTNDLEEAERKGSVTVTRRLNHEDGSVRDARTTILALRNETGVLGYGVAALIETSAPAPTDSPAGEGEINDTTSAETRRQLAESRTLLAAEIADRTQAETSRARLLRRLVVAQEDERRRLAHDLHDGLGQRLTALRLILEALDGQQSGPGAQPTETANALEMLARIDQDVDFIAWELRPAALDELGLARVLDSYVIEWSRHAGVPAVFHARPGNLPRFAPEVEASIYRIAQESLNNVVKHARAQSVNVLLELRGDNLALVVEDDGVGFHPAAAGETMIGLTGMRERALAVGGTLELEPTPGGGTTVLACIPTTGRHRERCGCPAKQPSPDDADSAPADRERIDRSKRTRSERHSNAVAGTAAGGRRPRRIHRDGRARTAQPHRPVDVPGQDWRSTRWNSSPPPADPCRSNGSRRSCVAWSNGCIDCWRHSTGSLMCRAYRVDGSICRSSRWTSPTWCAKSSTHSTPSSPSRGAN